MGRPDHDRIQSLASDHTASCIARKLGYKERSVNGALGSLGMRGVGSATFGRCRAGCDPYASSGQFPWDSICPLAVDHSPTCIAAKLEPDHAKRRQLAKNLARMIIRHGKRPHKRCRVLPASRVRRRELDRIERGTNEWDKRRCYIPVSGQRRSAICKTRDCENTVEWISGRGTQRTTCDECLAKAEPYSPTPRQRSRIMHRDHWVCQLCFRPIPDDHLVATDNPLHGEVDHVILRSNGGSNNDGNLQASHRLCNGPWGKWYQDDATYKASRQCIENGSLTDELLSDLHREWAA